tara:strand:+ start:103 stop:4389 length:4287 start_codon:yes stop_codon:yes gene_type:complete
MAIDNNFNNLWYDNNLYGNTPEIIPRGRVDFEQDPTFMDEVSAAWQLEPVGQVAMQLRNDNTWLSLPEEKIHDIDDQLIGFEDYFDHFVDVRNQTHLDYIKEKINYNNQLRSVRDNGGLMPEILAAFGDPLTYVPIPFVKGISFASRFKKGFALSAGVTATGEPFRQSLDPTATLSESAIYVAGGGILGGTIISTFGRRGVKNIGKDGDSDPGNLAERIFEKFYDSEGGKIKSTFYDQDSEDFLNINGQKKKVDYAGGEDVFPDEKILIGKDPVVEIKAGQNWRGKKLKHDTLIIDEDALKRKFKDGSYVEPDVPGSARIPEFDTYDSYLEFMIRKKRMKDDGTGPVGKTEIESEDLLNSEIVDDLIADKIGRQTAGMGDDRSWIAENVDRFVTTLGSLTNNKLKNKRVSNSVADFGLDMIGDGATVTAASKAGVAIAASALTKATSNHFKIIGNFNRRLQKGFQQYRKGINETNKEIVGYNFGATGIRASDMYDTGVKKLGFRKGEVDEVRFSEFTELLTRAIRDPEYFKTADPVIQGLANEIKGVYRQIGLEAEKLGMFNKQQHIEKIKLKYVPRIERAKQALKDATDPEIKELIQSRLDIAEARLGDLQKLQDDITDGLVKEFNPLVDNYVNRVYDIDAINKDIANEKWIAPEGVSGIDLDFMTQLKSSSYKGIVPGMVVSLRKNQIFTEIDVKSEVETLKGEYGTVTSIKGKKITVKFVDAEGKARQEVFGEGFLIHVKGQAGKKDNKYARIKNIDTTSGDIVVDLDGEIINVNRTKYKVKSRRMQDYDLEDKRYLSIPTEGTFRRLLFNNFKNEPNTYRYMNSKGEKKSVIDNGGSMNEIVYLNAKVNDTIQRIRRDGQNLNMDGDMAEVIEGGKFMNSESAFQSRTLNLSDIDLAPYLINDINYLLRMYSEKMNKRMEMTRKFGEANAETKLWDNEMDMLENITIDELPEFKRISTDLRDNRDKVYNIFNTADPASFMKSRLPAALRNWASTAMMGKVLFASIVDFARIPMVHGFANTFRYLNSKHVFAADKTEFNEEIAKAAWMGDVFDVQMNQANARHTGNTEYRVGRGDTMFGKFFDKTIGRPLEGVQSPFYHANLLSGWTHMMKQMTQHMSTHRFLEDSQKVLKGTATKQDIARLASYGISKEQARGIAKLPTYKTKNGFLYTKEDEWLSTPKGAHYGDLIRFASFMDVQRTIITPGIADKPNMMFGVIRIRNEGLTDAFDSNVFKFLGGFERTEFGGKFNNGFLALPFQFYAWSFAANRKLMLAGLSRREMDLAKGIVAMIGFAMMGDYLKNPMYYQHKSTQEKIYRAIEMSGVLGLVGDANFALEVISDGAFDTPMGIRPSIGTGGRFGDASGFDASGEVIGAGPSLLVDLVRAIGGDMPFDERAQLTRRLFPFNNLLYLDGINKKIVNSGAELFR